MVFSKIVMPKTWPLCTSAESNLRDGVLGKVEKNNFTVIPLHMNLQPSNFQRCECAFTCALT